MLRNNSAGRMGWVPFQGSGGHGKQAGVGRLVAKKSLEGLREPLEPVCLHLYEPRKLHPTSTPLPVEPKGGA
jgi:hypothetical protein